MIHKSNEGRKMKRHRQKKDCVTLGGFWWNYKSLLDFRAGLQKESESNSQNFYITSLFQ